MKFSKDNPFNNFKVTPKSAQDAIDFFSDTIDSLAREHKDNKIEDSKESTKREDKTTFNNHEIGIGNLYVAGYSAKWKDTPQLPVFDMLPTFFIMKMSTKMFQVLNIHYMPLAYRAKMLQILIEFTNNKTLNDRTKLRMSWSVIKAFSSLKLLEDCIKNHLPTHYTSRLVKIQPKNWIQIANLPTEHWYYSKTNKDKKSK